MRPAAARALLAARRALLLRALAQVDSPHFHQGSTASDAIVQGMRDISTGEEDAARQVLTRVGRTVSTSPVQFNPETAGDALESLLDARKHLLAALAALWSERGSQGPDATMDGDIAALVASRMREDEKFTELLREHATPQAHPSGPVVLAAVRAARKDLLAAVALVQSDRATTLIDSGESVESVLRRRAEETESATAAVGTGQEGNRVHSGYWRTLHDSHRLLQTLLQTAVDPDYFKIALAVADEDLVAADQIRTVALLTLEPEARAR